MEVVNRYYTMIYVNRFDRFGMVWLCLTYIWTAKRGQLRHCCVHVSSPAATKETGTPWASERIACVAPVEEESQGCLKMIEMHHGHPWPKKRMVNTWNYHDLSMTYMATSRPCFIDLFFWGTFDQPLNFFCTLLGEPANFQRKIGGGSWKRFRTCSDERRNNASGHRISTLFTGAFKCTATFIVSFNDHFFLAQVWSWCE